MAHLDFVDFFYAKGAGVGDFFSKIDGKNGTRIGTALPLVQ
jgi:hypothetical protein